MLEGRSLSMVLSAIAAVVNGANIVVTGISSLSILGGSWGFLYLASAAGTLTAGSFVVGAEYQILTVGSTDFTLIGAANNSIGTNFTATGIGTGTGTAYKYPINAIEGAGAVSSQSLTVAAVDLNAVTGNKINIQPYYTLLPPGQGGTQVLVGGITQLTSP